MLMSNAVAYRNYIEVKSLDGNGTFKVGEDYAFAYIGKEAVQCFPLGEPGGIRNAISMVAEALHPPLLPFD